MIRTLEGEHIASIGDWIIKGVKGEFYPCKPDIFTLTYEQGESREKRLEEALEKTVRVIENLYPDHFCGEVEAKHEDELRAVQSVFTEARAVLEDTK
jgi:hypothetical protein